MKHYPVLIITCLTIAIFFYSLTSAEDKSPEQSVKKLKQNGSIIVKAYGFRTNRGLARFALFKNEKGFPADKDKANREIIKFFSKLSKCEIKIIKGSRSKEKVLGFS